MFESGERLRLDARDERDRQWAGREPGRAGRQAFAATPHRSMPARLSTSSTNTRFRPRSPVGTDSPSLRPGQCTTRAPSTRALPRRRGFAGPEGGNYQDNNCPLLELRITMGNLVATSFYSRNRRDERRRDNTARRASETRPTAIVGLSRRVTGAKALRVAGTRGLPPAQAPGGPRRAARVPLGRSASSRLRRRRGSAAGAGCWRPRSRSTGPWRPRRRSGSAGCRAAGRGRRRRWGSGRRCRRRPRTGSA